jgi:hypothetical protein
VRHILGSDWGRLFNNWDSVQVPPDDFATAGWEHVGEAPATLTNESMHLFLKSLRILGTCIREAPEFAARKRRKES